MRRNIQAVLIAEVGSVTTRVSLIDTVAGEARLIGHAAVPSTIEPPQSDATIAILAAADEIGSSIGRLMIGDGRLITPKNNEGDGVDGVIVLTSAAGQMGVVIAAVASDISGRSAQRATLTTYTTILQTITLDNAVRTPEGRDTSWIEQQVQLLTGLKPDVVLITGGLEDGPQESLVRLAHIVGLTSLDTKVNSDGLQEQQVNARPVIYAGNSQASERVFEALSGRARLKLVDNLRPSFEFERLDPLRRELMQLYDAQILPRLPGAATLARLSGLPIRTSAMASGLMTRFVAELMQRSVLSFEVGSASTVLHHANSEGTTPVVLGNVGVGLGLGALLAQERLVAIARWLPFPIGERDLTHRILNKMLRPQLHPTTREDLLIEFATLREALAIGMQSLRDMSANPTYDLVIAGSGVLTHASHPGLALLAILDALQPGAESSLFAVDVHLDTFGLMAACGALAFCNPEAAIYLFERDLLRNTPLATCITAVAAGQANGLAVEAELQIADEPPRRISVNHGQIGAIPLAPGSSATLILRPAAGVRIGKNAAGVEVSSEVGAVRGSQLGVVIDARGRPLLLPADTIARQNLLWDWMVSLGVETGALPYDTTPPLPDIAVPILPPITPISNPSIDSPIPDAAPSLDSGFMRLRQTVEEPKKKGLFGRKK
jgi:hypothetical protein